MTENIPNIGAQSDQQKRLQAFNEGMDKLVQETKIAIRPQISPDGPIVTYVDISEQTQNAPDSN